METKRAEMIAKDLMTAHGLSEWKFEMRSMKSLFGYCYWSKKLITLSSILASMNSEEEVINTILHEIAHALAPKREHHGKEWKRIAVEIGCSGNRCYDAKVATPKKRWKATCGKCGYSFYKHRRRLICSCGKCNPKFDRTLLLTWTEEIAFKED